jgi:ribosome-binding ATPase YchF (GTP1/OBG family)
MEVRCWTIRQGTKAPQAAGVIHTDFEKVKNNPKSPFYYLPEKVIKMHEISRDSLWLKL